MPSNSTDNIYSSAQPIPADIIGYDNTESGLTAETAQAAIDELADAIDAVEEDITEIVQMPALPADSADGTYVLKATASSGTITYAWVAEV